MNRALRSDEPMTPNGEIEPEGSDVRRRSVRPEPDVICATSGSACLVSHEVIHATITLVTGTGGFAESPRRRRPAL